MFDRPPVKVIMPEQQLFDLTIAEAEAEIQPHCMADDLGWETVILVMVDPWCTHTTSMAHHAGVGQTAQQIDNALRPNAIDITSWEDGQCVYLAVGSWYSGCINQQSLNPTRFH